MAKPKASKEVTSLKEIKINEMRFTPNPKVLAMGGYANDYVKLHEQMHSGEIDTVETLRNLVKTDLWFVLYFIIKNKRANHPFIVQACKDVAEGPNSHTIDLWARGHFKTSVISTAETIQDVCKDQEHRIGIFSYSKPAAKKILRVIKNIFEADQLLKECFPETFYENPKKNSPKWSEDEGIVVRREGNYREATVSAYGLLEGMPTGDHFTKRIYDDILVDDIANSPELNEKLKETFDLSFNLSTFEETDIVRIVGTPYRHDDVIMYIKNKIDPITDNPVYHCRIKTATVDGTFNGASVFVPERILTEARANRRTFNAQQLCNPTPFEEVKLDPGLLVEVPPKKIPENLLKFMMVDPAGTKGKTKVSGDAWSIMCVGIERRRDDVGNLNMYILDLVLEELSIESALKAVADMYLRNGRVLRIGVEKVGISTMEVHISNHLFAKGKVVTIENGGLYILRTGGVSKEFRIESNLAWPLNQKKIHYASNINATAIERLKNEMKKFPFWKNDGLDTLAYAYDMAKAYKFAKPHAFDPILHDPYDEREELKKGWMTN